MIRVLNIISDTNIGGAGRVLLNYLRYTDRESFSTAVLLPRGSALIAPLREFDVEVAEVDAMADRSYARGDVPPLKEKIRALCPDLVHTHGALSARIAAKRCRLPVIYSRHSAFPVPARLRYPPGRWVNHWLNERYADHIIAVSPAARQNLVDAGVNPAKITTMMNGVAPLTRTTAAEQRELRAALGLSEDCFLFGILARLEHYKGHLDILHAAQRLKEQGGRDFCVLIAGEGDFAREIEAEIAALGLAQQVRMLGFRSDVRALLSILDVQLNASYGTETSSLSLLEGMSMGLPAIASDYGGNPNVITHGENGLLFPTRDSAALARAMAECMEQPERLAALQAQAQARYAREFTGEIFARKVEALYRQVLKGEK